MTPSDDLLSQCLRQPKPNEEKEEEERLPLRNKALDGMYHWQIEEVAGIEKAYQFLEKAGPQGQFCNYHGSTRTGLERKINKSQGLPHQTRDAAGAKMALRQCVT